MPLAYERHIKVIFGMQDLSEEAKAKYGDEGNTTFSTEIEYDYLNGKNRYIEFQVSTAKAAESDGGEVKVWNLSEQVLKQIYDVLTAAGMVSEAEECDKGFIPWLDIYAGYGDWCPLVYTGKVKGLPATVWEKADTVTSFVVVADSTNHMRLNRTNSSYVPGTLHSTIVTDLLFQLDLPMGTPMELGTDFPIKGTLTYGPDISVREALDREAQATGSSFWVRNDHAYFVPTAYGKEPGIILSQYSGLIFGAKPVHRPQWGGTEELGFTSLMNPLLEVDSIITIQSEGFNGSVLIIEVEYVANRHDYYAVCKATLDDAEKREEKRIADSNALKDSLGLTGAVKLNPDNPNQVVTVDRSFNSVMNALFVPSGATERPGWKLIDGKWVAV
jgi:hypothetical protein